MYLQENDNTSSREIKKGFSGLQVFGVTFLAVILTLGITLFAVKVYFFPSSFTPVVLDAEEQQQLVEKLKVFDRFGWADGSGQDENRDSEVSPEFDSAGKLVPSAYSERDSDREINLTEREFNGLLAQNTDLAGRLVFDFAENLISAKLLVLVDPDFPVLGGKTIRIKAGVELAYWDNRPVVKLRGISLMGVPLPNAWLGGLKNIDLISEFGRDPGFWNSFAAGVDSVGVEEGRLKIVLNE